MPDPTADAATDAFLRRVLAASPDCIKVLDLDGRLVSMTDAGRAALEIDDLTPHLGTCWTDWWHGPDHDAAAAAVAAAVGGGTGRFEARATTAKGTAKWWDVTVSAIPGPGGRPEQLLAVSRDVTDRRTAADAAAERLDRLRSVIESAGDYAVISVGLDGRIDGWSTGAAGTFGWPEAAAVGRPFDLIWSAEDVAAGGPGHELAVARERGMCPDNRFHVRADGRRIYVVGVCRPVHDAAGELTGYVKVCRDDTDKRAAEQAAADAQLRSDAALTAGQVATYTWDIAADRVYGDESLQRLFGLRLDAAGSAPLAEYVAAIHPDDRGPTSDRIAAAVAAGEAFEAEYRVAAGGRERWVVARGRVERDAAGRPVRFPGVIVDVTDRKAAETDRKAAETQLRAERELLRTVFDQAPDDAILVMDAGRVLTAWNPAAERITGWTAGEAVGRPADLIFTPEDRAAGVPAQETARAAADGKAADERWHLRRDGRQFWGSGTMNALHDADGSVRGYLKVFRDATERHEEARTLAFLGRLADGLLDHPDPDRIIDTVERRLGEHLSASRVLVTEVSADGQGLTVGRAWAVPGLRDLAGTYRTADFGPRLVADYVAGRVHVRRDADREYPPGPERDAFRAVQAAASIDVPVRIDGRLRFVLVVHQAAARDWTDAEVTLVRQVADRVAADVQRARALRATRESEARLRALVTASSDALYRMSPDWSEMWQLNGGAFIPDTDRPTTGWLADYIVPEDQPKVRAAIDAAIAGRTIFELEHRVRRADGGVGWTASRAVPILGPAGEIAEWFGVATDVTDRKRAEAELAFGRHQLELIFRESPAAMALWSGEELVFERVNPEFAALFGNRPLAGRPLLEAVPELRGQGFDDQLRRVLHTGQPFVGREVLARIADAAGGPERDRYFDFTYLQVRDPAGRPWGVYDHAVDVTDRVLARQAAERADAQVRAALAEAEQAGRMKDDFLATLSHELRTPLNAIVGWTQILKGPGNGPEDYAEGLAVIDRNARAQTQIIEDILDMSRIVSGKLRLDVQRVDLANLVRAGADTVRPAADAKGIRLQLVLDPAAGPVTGDPNRLHQVFWNLLSNAVKFTPKGGRVQVLLERVNSHVEMSVVDTGEGISAEFLPHVFDRFRQADASTTRRHGGLGLGLAIVKQLVELHGGSVRVKSPGPGRGATFVVALPLTVVHAEPVGPAEPREHPGAEVPADAHRLACDQLAGVSVVAVDDEPDGREVIRRLLSDCGATVRTAGSAAEAVALIRAAVPTVLVSDIGMPGEDGYALIRRVRDLPGPAGAVPAAALTAYARAADRVKALEAGFQMHLSKPVDPAELVVTVAALARLAGAVQA